MNPIYILGALSVAYLISNKKSTTTTSTSPKNTKPTDSSDDENPNSNFPKPPAPDPNLPGVDDKNLPGVDDPEDDLPTLDEEDADQINELNEIPNVDPNQPKPNIPDQDNNGLNIDLVMEKYYSQWLQLPNEKPAVPDPNSLWISKSCKSWAVGKYFVVKNGQATAYLPEKYVFVNKPNSSFTIL